MNEPEVRVSGAAPEQAAPFAAARLPGLIRNSPAVELALRAALASPFLASGLLKLSDRDAAVVEFTMLGIWSPQIVVVAVIVTQLGGSLLLLTRRGAWPGACILAVFTAVATIIAHPFWLAGSVDRGRQLTTFLEHLAIIGGLGAAAVLAAGFLRPNQQV